MLKHPKTLARLDDKVVVITGASDGIGVETARSLASLGATLVLPVRNLAKGQAVRDDLVRSTGNEKIELVEMDLASLASIRTFSATLLEKHPKVDVLVLNAGLTAMQHKLTVDGFETTFGVNHLGHFALTLALLPALRAAPKARVVVVSSKLHTNGLINFDDLHYVKKFEPGLMKGPYADSKLANALFAVELAERLKPAGITVNYLHPGVVSTAIARDMHPFFQWASRTFLMTPEKGAWTSVFVAASPDLDGVTGKYFDNCREARPSALVSDAALRKRLWDVSETLTDARWS